MKHDACLAFFAKFISYNPDDGSMKWVAIDNPYTPKHKLYNTVRSGKNAYKTPTRHGYYLLTLSIDGVFYRVMAHRLAWFIGHGVLPTNEIDHVNGVGTDNRLINLRDAPIELNRRNAKMGKNNTSGYSGVRYESGRERWLARVYLNGTVNYLGRFKLKDDAIKAVDAFRSKNGFTYRHGKNIQD